MLIDEVSIIAKAGNGGSGLVHFYSKIWESSGFLLVKEAGGKITDKNGKELELNFGSDEGFQFVASNGLIHEELLKIKGL